MFQFATFLYVSPANLIAQNLVILTRSREFLGLRGGATGIEYALIVAVVGGAIAASATLLGVAIGDALDCGLACGGSIELVFD